MASPVLACSLAALSTVTSFSVPAPQLAAPIVEFAAPESDGDYEAALTAVDEANIAVNRDPESSLPMLEAALEQLVGFGPQIAADPKGREALDLSQLNLARALLLADNEDRAARVMDAVLLTARDRKLPIKRFGPTLVAFHDARRKLLDERGAGSIQIQCRLACRIVIDEQPATANSGLLYLGPHRVWVEAADGSAPAERHEIELGEDGVSEVLYYPEIADDDECEIVAPPPVAVEPPPPPPKRILPRWAEISVAVIGVGAVAAGGVLLGLDGKCPGGQDPVADASECPDLYEGTVSGIAAVGIGSALIVLGGVTLAVDEVRVGKQTGRQAVLAWQMRF
ncbi:hypothetical protein DB30_05792 [Enhygromyxa salina]|uniref:PEGA domain-containing protein n=1 Tax=Enhygromyxa salina TaxID=215803 RepID=A0A0C1ZW43_9BACT|nr:hypothetical protein [Enhygromyxa salina]KIG15248.1 hypothetical protein DB30_05792 [Enhygromyxa salina]